MTEEVASVLRHIAELAAKGGIESFSFALVRPDGIPEFGHAHPTYDLLGATELAKAGLAAKLFRGAGDVPGFEPQESEKS